MFLLQIKRLRWADAPILFGRERSPALRLGKTLLCASATHDEGADLARAGVLRDHYFFAELLVGEVDIPHSI